jgi:hypothetical protein
MHGEGELVSPSGATYKGKFANGVREGLGAMRYATGEVYNGLWKQDKVIYSLAHCFIHSTLCVCVCASFVAYFLQVECIQ